MIKAIRLTIIQLPSEYSRFMITSQSNKQVYEYIENRKQCCQDLVTDYS